MKKILLVQLDQFGYLTDSLKWCENLHDEYDIDVVCYNSKLPRVQLDNVNVHYVSLSTRRVVHAVRFMLIALLHMLFFRGIIFVVAFPHCDVFKRLLPWKKMHLDIRTVSIDRNSEVREAFDKELRKYAECYDSVSVISQGVQERLGISKSYLLPLGSDVLSFAKRDYSVFNFLYTGTLKFRDIDKTIEGVRLFHEKNPNVKFRYDIVGDGFTDDYPEGLAKYYQTLVEKYDLLEYVHIHGAKPYAELSKFFDDASYGISFVPITPWYDVQPPTKTFEYVLSGLFTIATKTKCNLEIVNSGNGLLIEDTPESVCAAMEYVKDHHLDLHEDVIRNSLIDYSWGKIVNKYLKPILNM